MQLLDYIYIPKRKKKFNPSFIWNSNLPECPVVLFAESDNRNSDPHCPWFHSASKSIFCSAIISRHCDQGCFLFYTNILPFNDPPPKPCEGGTIPFHSGETGDHRSQVICPRPPVWETLCKVGGRDSWRGNLACTGQLQCQSPQGSCCTDLSPGNVTCQCGVRLGTTTSSLRSGQCCSPLLL